MIRKFFLLLSLAVPLVACGNPHQAELKEAQAACRATYGHARGENVPRINCLNDAIVRYGFTDSMSPLLHATALSLASKVDNGQMTFEDANLQYQKVAFAARQELAQSQAVQRAADAAESRANAQHYQQQQLIDQQQQYQQQLISQMNRPIQTSCSRMGSFTNCTTQ